MLDGICCFFIFFGGFMSWTIAIGTVFEFRKRPYHYAFRALMFCLGTLQLHNGLVVAGVIGDFIVLAFVHLPLLAWVGPLLLFSFNSANDDSFHLKYVDSLHFLIGLIMMIVMIPLSTLDHASKLMLVMRPPDITNSNIYMRLYSLFFFTAVVTLIGYILYLFRECFFMLDIRFIKKKMISPYLTLIIVVMLPLMFILLGSILMVGLLGSGPLSYLQLIEVLAAFSFLFPLVFLIMGKKKINFFMLLNNQIRRGQYEVSILKNLDVSNVLSRMQSLMDEEKIFCDESLSLESMADRLSIKPYQLSRIINEKFGDNFNYFVNKYRIEESKKIFLEASTRTIITVAYSVGFNSTAIFNKWFKRLTGISPKEFRSSIR